MVMVTNNHAEKKPTIAEVFDNNNTCILEDGRIAFCAWMDAQLFNKVDKENYILCFTVDDDGETNLEYIKTNTPAIPCDVKIVCDVEIVVE